MNTRATLALALVVGSVLCAVCALDASTAHAQAAPASLDIAKLVDGHLEEAWRRDAISPAPQSSDSEFLRRVYLDVVGEPPTRAQAGAFLADAAPNKRARLIDRLLEDPRFGEHLADRWTAILARRGGDEAQTGGRDLLAVWLAAQFNANTGFARIMEQLITATGPISENPAAAYYVLMGQPRPATADMAGQTLKHFAGIQIQCAQCHDHPYQPAWTQETFGGIAGFFNALDIRYDFTVQPLNPTISDQPLPAPKLLEAYLKNRALDAEARNRAEEMLRYRQPRLPGDRPVKTQAVEFYRPMLYRWLVAPENRTARQYLANRFWSFLFGTAFVSPVDDFNAFNKPAHPALLEALADAFAARGYDVKAFYRGLLNSRAYQLSSAGRPANAQPWHFASYPVRQLTPEQFFASFFVLAPGDAFVRSFERQTQGPLARLRQYADFIEQQRKQNPDGNYPRFDRELLARYEKLLAPMGPRWQIRRALAQRYTTRTMDDEQTESESFSLSIDQALEVMNGDVTRRLGGSLNGTLLFEILRDEKEDSARLDQLWLAVLTRQPSDRERRLALDFLARERQEGRRDPALYEDLFFALVSTTEFATNK
ncbi:DUF1549 domain-containing protein [bacterium]|nr:MAG: DUF1549 domain-containing protein [bacterium]RIK63591.1 MAG: hypothetical protein DCC64_07050 [Planctomycetota bacterium]